MDKLYFNYPNQCKILLITKEKTASTDLDFEMLKDALSR